MARVVYEFFRPQISTPVPFLIGLVAQDDDGLRYRAVDAPVPDDVDREFYGLNDREALMNDDRLQRIEAFDPAVQANRVLEAHDPRVLDALRSRGTHHFVYSPVVEIEGSASVVADREMRRLSDAAARRDL